MCVWQQFCALTVNISLLAGFSFRVLKYGLRRNPDQLCCYLDTCEDYRFRATLKMENIQMGETTQSLWQLFGDCGKLGWKENKC